jgi:hypothetical protein
LSSSVSPALTLQCRFMQESDRSFILDSWVKSYRNSGFAVRRGAHYFDDQERIARHCLETAKTIVATDEDTPDVILGWCCGTKAPQPVLHYLYVLHAARRRNIATILVAHQLGNEPGAVRITHKPPPWVVKLVPPTWRFQPIGPGELT